MGYHQASVHQQAFENSRIVIFVYEKTRLVGFGRAISDGVIQGAIYDVAVLPDYQSKGIGRIIIEAIVTSLPQCNFILYASAGKEKFYEKLKFRKMKTAMGLFKNAESMQSGGMIV